MIFKAQKGFPLSLVNVPVLLPTNHAAVRSNIGHWFERLGIKPNIVGEFEDRVLLKTFNKNVLHPLVQKLLPH